MCEFLVVVVWFFDRMFGCCVIGFFTRAFGETTCEEHVYFLAPNTTREESMERNASFRSEPLTG